MIENESQWKYFSGPAMHWSGIIGKNFGISDARQTVRTKDERSSCATKKSEVDGIYLNTWPR